ncbi:MAG: hypothetical protein KUG78_20500 [Kangiellaceae bacterium]|nr:hypothetical protein [Kangiellaceae bacterium]
MSQKVFDVVYAGAVLNGFSDSQVRQNFISHLKIPNDKVARLFSGKRITLKKSLNKQQAEQWQKNLLKIGAEAVLVPSVESGIRLSDIALPSFISESDSDDVVAVKNMQQATPANQEEYDEQMQSRIKLAKAMIEAQKLESGMKDTKQSNPLKRIVWFSLILSGAMFVLYFYMDSVK